MPDPCSDSPQVILALQFHFFHGLFHGSELFSCFKKEGERDGSQIGSQDPDGSANAVAVTPVSLRSVKDGRIMLHFIDSSVMSSSADKTG